VEFVLEPGTSHRPVRIDGSTRDVEFVGDFGDGQATEDAQRDDIRMPGVEFGKLTERIIEIDEVNVFIDASRPA